MSQEEHNVEVVHRFNELVNTEDYDAMDELFAPSFVDHNPSWHVETLEDVKQILASSHQSFDIKNTIEDTIASGDEVVIRVTSRGRHLVEAFGVPPTGKETSMELIEIYRFEGGRIAERWLQSDIVGLMKQLGVELPL